MIFYNMRYRGPYEYDKFILNIFQYCNLINDIKNDSLYVYEEDNNIKGFICIDSISFKETSIRGNSRCESLFASPCPGKCLTTGIIFLSL